MPRRLLVVWLPVLVSVTPAAAWAQAARVDLHLGLGRRDDTLNAGRTQASADGSALSDLALAGTWFGDRAWVGLGGGAGVERFSLRVAEPADSSSAPEVVVTGWQARGGLALRTGPLGDRLRLHAQLAYGAFQVPVAYLDGSASTLTLGGGALRAHGPAASAGLALTLPAGLGLEFAFETLPTGFGAEYRGTPVTPRRFGAQAAFTFGSLAVGTMHLAARLSAELSRTTATGLAIDITQTRQSIALGLQATWPSPSAPSASPSPPPSVPAAASAPPAPPPPPPPAAPSVITGLIRSDLGAPITARIRVVELALEVVADPRGAFALEVPPGQYTLVIEAEGFVAQTKAIQAGSGEQNIYNVDLHAEAP